MHFSFNDTVNISDHMASYGRMADNELGRKRLWANVRQYRVNCVEGVRNTTKTVSQANRIKSAVSGTQSRNITE